MALTRIEVKEIFNSVGFPTDIPSQSMFSDNGETLDQFLAGSEQTEWEHQQESYELLEPNWLEYDNFILVYTGTYPLVTRVGGLFELDIMSISCDSDGDWNTDHLAEITTAQEWIELDKRDDDTGEQAYLEHMAETGIDSCDYWMSLDPQRVPCSFRDDLSKRAWYACMLGSLKVCNECHEKFHRDNMVIDQEPAPVSEESGAGCSAVDVYYCRECAEGLDEQGMDPEDYYGTRGNR